MNGIFAVYATGNASSSVVLLVLKDGTIAGADVGGGVYEGKYDELEGGLGWKGTVSFEAPPNSGLVTGHTAVLGFGFGRKASTSPRPASRLVLPTSVSAKIPLVIVLLLFYLNLRLQEVPTNRNLAAEKGRFLLLKLGYMGLFAQFTAGTPLWDRRLPARTLLSMKH